MSQKTVLIIMGSESDLEAMRPAATVLRSLEVPFEVSVASAHRTPDRATELAEGARASGVGVIIAGAGMAHHLGGALAARTTLPIIAVPLAAGKLGGVDSLLSAVQMPPGVPVATVAVGGAKNAAFLAAQILAVTDEPLAARLEDHRARQRQQVTEADLRVQAALSQPS